MGRIGKANVLLPFQSPAPFLTKGRTGRIKFGSAGIKGPFAVSPT
ncbi:MAG: hypothetical protein AVDCRST_MAG56-3 [uncultured Cytophagales bacterium]|uniref:Uncharacterized protein n=1 Tax=uncultured Cytophagales bacterium TaxID=158755 RepID=A0A6J4H2U4_9SPHI|nr:MAG: hypothetical protein AVDCRST_MAG56-3 [uncultured Cytophagales bacterium]